MKTIAELRKAGYKVRVTHYRYIRELETICYPGSFKDCLKPEFELRKLQPVTWHRKLVPYGGKTIVSITSLDGKELVGESVCSKNDSYCRKQGVKIACGRALANHVQV